MLQDNVCGTRGGIARFSRSKLGRRFHSGTNKWSMIVGDGLGHWVSYVPI